MNSDPKTNRPRISREPVDPARAVAPETMRYVGIRCAAWIMGAISVLLICVFDLGPPLAFNDDWTYAWDVRHLNLLHIHLYPTGSALALVQIVWAWVVTMGHTDQRLLRLSIVPFVLLTMYVLYKLARLLKADRTWSAIAAIAPLSFPVFTADATAFMSEVPYIALLLLASLGAIRWSEGRKWIMLCVVTATLATLQRQTGLTIPVAVTGALLLYRRDFRPNPDVFGLILLWGCCLAAIAVPTATGITPSAQGQWTAAILSRGLIPVLGDLLFLPGMVGLSLVLFLPGLALGLQRSVGSGRTKLWITALAVWELIIVARVGDIFPGNVFSAAGFVWQAGESGKPPLFTLPVYLGVVIVAVLSLLLFVWRWRDWWPAKTGQPGALLLLMAITQFLPLAFLHTLAFDRYYIPVVLPLLPLAARAASRTARPVLAPCLALVLAFVSIILYVAGEEDYQARKVARNQAACLAYQYTLPLDVNAGYEANAVYVEVPYYDRTGVILGGLSRSQNFSLNGPANPIITIEVVGPNDPRPGYNYLSLASGKVVLIPGPRGAGIDIKMPDKGLPNCL